MLIFAYLLALVLALCVAARAALLPRPAPASPVAAWARRAWSIISDQHAAIESADLTAALTGSAVVAGLEPCINHPDVPAVTTVEVDGHLIAVCAGCLDLAGQVLVGRVIA
jgi:hypothetical protein